LFAVSLTLWTLLATRLTRCPNWSARFAASVTAPVILCASSLKPFRFGRLKSFRFGSETPSTLRRRLVVAAMTAAPATPARAAPPATSGTFAFSTAFEIPPALRAPPEAVFLAAWALRPADDLARDRTLGPLRLDPVRREFELLRDALRDREGLDLGDPLRDVDFVREVDFARLPEDLADVPRLVLVFV
jgi:hypothetical protein